MSDKQKGADTSRRDVLKLGAFGAAAAAGTAALGAAGEAAAAEAPSTKDGYRETAHVKTYYRSARF